MQTAPIPSFTRPTRAELAAAVSATLKDVIAPRLGVLFCGINPGLYSGATGHHFARPGNRFWPALHDGGFTPRHAQLLAEDLDTATLVRTIDRFLMYYVRTADRLQRTAVWVEDHEGGLDAIRAVVLGDSLGIGVDLDQAMAGHVEGSEDEWAAALDDQEELRRFGSFVNAPD